MSLEFDLDDGFGSEATLGLIVLQTDETLENEMRAALGTIDQCAVACYHSRIPSQPIVTKETLAQMQLDLPAAAALLSGSDSPLRSKFSAIAYCCTSGATVIGRENVATAIKRHYPDASTTDPMSAVVSACRNLGITRLGLLTPYIAEVSVAMQDLLRSEGINIVAFGSFEQSDESTVAHITEASTLAAIEAVAAQAQCDGIFASCTNLRTFGIIKAAESKIGIPVISSNQALLWHLLRLSGSQLCLRGYGRLLEGSTRHASL
jgi:maleate isomerase